MKSVRTVKQKGIRVHQPWLPPPVVWLKANVDDACDVSLGIGSIVWCFVTMKVW